MIIKIYYDLKIFIAKVIKKITIKFDEKYISKLRNIFVRNKDFSIISNNCWAGHIYRKYNIEYLTPTVGLFIMPEDYIKFCKDLKYYLNLEMSFINPGKSKFANEIEKIDDRFGKYPIGVLEDIEIHFLHYKNEIEAKAKWDRRKKRVNFNNLIYKFNDQNGCTEEQLVEFNNLKLDGKKICFVSKKNDDLKNIVIKEYSYYDCVKDDMLFTNKYFKINKYLI